jgi:predicted esterase
MVLLTILLACTADPGPGGESRSGEGDTGPLDSQDSAAPSLCSGGSGAPEGGTFYTVGGDSYWVFVPRDLPDCAPLLLFGHGGNNQGNVMNGMWTDMMQTGLLDEAQARGFVLMVPFLEDVEGPQEHSWQLGLEAEMQGFITDAGERLDLDLARVRFAGTSAGGHMACYWGLYDPHGVTSVAVLSAGIGSYFDYPEPEPDPKLHFTVIHDPNDHVVPYSRSEQLVADLEAHGHPYVFETPELGGNGHGWSPEATGIVLDSWPE